VAQAPHQHIQRVSRGFISVVRGETATHTHLRNRLLSIIWVTVVIGFLSTLLVYFLERHEHHTQIHSLFDAFIFAWAQLLTASSVAAPTSTAGKVLEVFFDIYAITVVATLAGSFGSFFHRRSEEHDQAVADAQAAHTPDAESSGAAQAGS
jgi:glucan phosphoethanolaminetransferase (alkaline phosphatase superfamily)